MGVGGFVSLARMRLSQSDLRKSSLVVVRKTFMIAHLWRKPIAPRTSNEQPQQFWHARQQAWLKRTYGNGRCFI